MSLRALQSLAVQHSQRREQVDVLGFEVEGSAARYQDAQPSAAIQQRLKNLGVLQAIIGIVEDKQGAALDERFWRLNLEQAKSAQWRSELKTAASTAYRRANRADLLPQNRSR